MNAVKERSNWLALLCSLLAITFLSRGPQAYAEDKPDEAKASGAVKIEAKVQKMVKPQFRLMLQKRANLSGRLQASEKAETKAPAAQPAGRTIRAVDVQQLLKRVAAQRKAEEEARQADPAWQPSHEETAVIRVGPENTRGCLNNFCLNLDGNLLACYAGTHVQQVSSAGSSEAQTKQVSPAGEIRVLSPDGRLLATWSLPTQPQAICVHRDGTVFVGGDGRLLRLDPKGNVLAIADSPAVAKPEAETQPPQTEPEQQKAQQSKSIAQALVEALTGTSARQEDTRQAEVSRQQAEYLKQRKRQVTGIAVSDQDLFVACPSPTGYTYAVYRLDHDFGNAEKIVDGLRGCCGQMDIQAKDGELWIAENSRHCVERYDREGKLLSKFGRADRKAADGFGGCCEPKNLRFGPGGELYAAESGPPTCVKRFTPDGQFLGVVTLADFKGGCVRTTVDVSADGRDVFMLDTTCDSIRKFSAQDLLPTHKQVGTISVPSGEKKAELHTLCVSREGNILAASGGERTTYVRTTEGLQIETVSEPAAIRVISPEGTLLETWALEMTPQALNVGPDGLVYVGGQGRLAKLDGKGKVLQMADSPNLSELPPLPEIPEEEPPKTDEEQEAKKAEVAKLRNEATEAIKSLQEAARQRRDADKEDQEAVRAASVKYNQAMAAYLKVQSTLRAATTSPRAAAMQARMAALRKLAITGIAVTEQDIFVACPATKGYGYEVWRTDLDFGSPEKIVTNLRGCCGQMDIQAKDGELWVAENSRGRVVRYDRHGKQLDCWGKLDRKNVEGFGSCCNPMNIRFGPGGELYTSEASLGRIKRYSPDGKLLGLVATADIVPGCKHVAIGINEDASRLYLLDITRSQIVVLASVNDPAHNDNKDEDTE